MTRPLFGGAGLLAALLCSSAAFAEVTAEQVWASWQKLTSSYGQTLTAESEARSGDTLVVSGVKIASTFEGGSLNGSIEKVNFRELGDGTVEVTMSPEYPVAIEATDPEGKKNTINLLVRQPDLKVIASGSDTETKYVFTAPTMKLSVEDMTAAEKPFDMKLDADLTALSGDYLVTSGETTTVVSNMKAASMGLVMSMTEPETNNVVNIKSTVNELAGSSTGTLLDMAAMADMAAALKAGFKTEGDFTYGTGTMDFDTTSASDNVKGSATIGSGSINFAMDADKLNYGGGAKDVAIKVSGSTIPVPELSLSYGEGSFNLLMPVSKSETPNDFAFLTRVIDLKLSDDVWSLFDPASVLPRDPATVVIDTKGQMNWLIDIMDPKQTEAVPTETVPAEMHALDVNELTVKLAGASVEGKGGFTFDNTDTTTFPGVPAPTGKMDLKVVGANGLLDKLIQLGFVPEDQAMGARMMMGLFAKPVEGQEDTLTSTLEFKDKGFYANGQRLQ
ncbi:MAG: hypothetical protein DI533_19065 [Cereibacter sphaeroides]|uniref:DUF2125 domain-containing protein n=1 Tax=Cereibacter sphaeroides TaxID=1063 RepID=A0A2W5TXA5_CERSP|nr:MAG: hypothetical protein DI533_19065 [Cereibacter sphaeroides]